MVSPYKYYVEVMSAQISACLSGFIQGSTEASCFMVSPTPSQQRHSEPLPAWIVKHCQNATANVDQGGNKSSKGYKFHSEFQKFLTRFHEEINPQKFAKDFGVQNPEKKTSAIEPSASNSLRTAETIRTTPCLDCQALSERRAPMQTKVATNPTMAADSFLDF